MNYWFFAATLLSVLILTSCSEDIGFALEQRQERHSGRYTGTIQLYRWYNTVEMIEEDGYTIPKFGYFEIDTAYQVSMEVSYTRHNKIRFTVEDYEVGPLGGGGPIIGNWPDGVIDTSTQPTYGNYVHSQKWFWESENILKYSYKGINDLPDLIQKISFSNDSLIAEFEYNDTWHYPGRIEEDIRKFVGTKQ